MLFCRHNWELKLDIVTRSKIEVTIQALKESKVGNIPWQMCDATRKYIQFFVCSKCGKIKRFVESV